MLTHQKQTRGWIVKLVCVVCHQLAERILLSREERGGAHHEPTITRGATC